MATSPSRRRTCTAATWVRGQTRQSSVARWGLMFRIQNFWLLRAGASGLNCRVVGFRVPPLSRYVFRFQAAGCFRFRLQLYCNRRCRPCRASQTPTPNVRTCLVCLRPLRLSRMKCMLQQPSDSNLPTPPPPPPPPPPRPPPDL